MTKRFTRDEIDKLSISLGDGDECYHHIAYMLTQQQIDIDRLCDELYRCNIELKDLDFAKDEYERVQKLLKEIRG